MAADGDARSLIAQRNAHAHVRVCSAMRVPEDWPARHYDFSGARDIRENLSIFRATGAPALRDLIRVSNDRVWRLPIYTFWESLRLA
jgi:hypothetical protein